ncbi:adenosylcobinamide-GDP ribazoletransferase [Nocardioides seonyuensis]|uniref:Adenosylcobinamide-GDP ribazoletransferase n=1 Tax=Nocardioides seonyuensis TaxID=2518371 RepID=A0A4P7IH56_9ACTN|nr:adenosylcobinamide-GDP ribazoletransferase [Nocardioides seonyuensis]QBX56694.1 adenosylcobinamide-GDP ribazoletransferase [Nocardioides seonyuensis]
MTRLRDGWLLATGTLTVLRVPPPTRVDRGVAGAAMALAPIAAVPLGLAVAGVCLLGEWLDVAPLVTSYAVVGTLALGTRALHWDGLADTADGLTASYDRTRSLEVMRLGNIGPAGVLAIVLVASLQAAGASALVPLEHGWLVLGLLVVVSRSALTLACVRGVPPARPDGLGALHIGSVGPLVAAVVALTAAAVAGLALHLDGSPWIGVAGWLAMVAAVLLLLFRCVRRLGGVTGDVLGACVEVALMVLLVSVSVQPGF